LKTEDGRQKTENREQRKMKKTRIIVITTVLLIISASTAYAAGITIPSGSSLDVNTGP